MSSNDKKIETTLEEPTLLESALQESTLQESTLKVGSILKERFLLVSIIGVGGMGVVFKAKDLLQAELGEESPFVAVKVLNDDFKKHPQAFLTLQKETKKTQALSHPNIVNVYDFDRDGDNVYMTMELLKGESLDCYLSKYHPDGMPIDKALPLIKDIAQALSIAHQAGIVHSDFKPNNVFITDEGEAKVFDFGIAHVTRTDQQEELAYLLKALTPAYASLSRLKGAEPEMRDDLYALACVISMMLTGKHPYDKLNAQEAYEKGLAVERIPQLSRKQQEAIEKCLSFDKAYTYPTVQAFSNVFFEPRDKRYQWGGLFFIVILLVFVVIYLGPVRDLMEEQARVNIAERLISVDFAERHIEIDALDNMDDIERQLVLRYAQKRLLEQYAQDIERHLAEDDINGLKVAGDILTQSRKLYPDSAFLADIYKRWQARKQVAIKRLEREYEVFLSNRNILPRLDKRTIANTKNDLSTIEPNHMLLTDERLPMAFARLVNEYLFFDKRQEAQQAMMYALEQYPQHQALKTLKIRVDARVKAPAEAMVSAYVFQSKEDKNAEEKQKVSLHFQAVADVLKNTEQPLVGIKEALVKLEGLSAVRYRQVLNAVRVYLDYQLRANKARVARVKTLKKIGHDIFPGDVRYAVVKRKRDPCKRAFKEPVLGIEHPGMEHHCIDRITAKQSAPELVVIPALGKRKSPFAMTRTEVSRRAFSFFCRATKACETYSENLQWPVTDITLDDAIGYARWLSNKTGYVYRLPTLQEWQHAALADSGDYDSLKDYNCRIQLDGKIVRGKNLRGVQEGFPNRWGVLNVFGNAREWVEHRNGFSVVGGSFEESLKRCTVDNVQSHDGSKGRATGFRLVRELR